MHWKFLRTKKEVLFLFGIDSEIWFFSIYNKHRRVSAFIIEEETIIQIGNQHFWLWIAIEPVNKSVLGIYILDRHVTPTIVYKDN